MLETLSILPLPFWVAVIFLLGGAWWAVNHLREGLGLPLLAVLGTAGAWYIGDALYNDYTLSYALLFKPSVRDEAWWQVVLFLAVFLFLAPEVHHWFNQRERRRASQIFRLAAAGSGQKELQTGLERLFWACLGLWVLLSVMAALRLQGETIYYFFPFLDHQANPWLRGRIGAGYDFLLSFAGYLELFVSAMFGIIAALVEKPRIRWLAIGLCFLTWPFFLFDRARNVMLAILLPALLAWVFLRLRGAMWRKLLILGGCFIVINAWFTFVVDHRSNGTIATAFAEEGFNLKKNSNSHHEGLNMFQELCWINTFLDNGTYKPNWGRRYLAEIVNPIPRTLWHGKPMIGIDYALLRGQSFDEGGAGVGATISTGLIGQGVVNFGIVLGPVFAAFLMTLWTAFLARLDLDGQLLGRLPLYGLGLILTFNLGRDITFITLYTIVFGYLVIRLLDRKKPARPKRKSPSPAPGAKQVPSPPTLVSSSEGAPALDRSEASV